MASRSLRFFVTPDEFSTWLAELAAKEGLSFWMRTPPEHHGRELSLEQAMTASTWRFYIGDRGAEVTDGGELNPTEAGLVAVNRPELDGEVLFLAELSARSDWRDERGRARECKRGLELFAKLGKSIKRKLGSPVWARAVTGGEARAYRDVHFSEGAAKWAREGGQLRQRGVANVAYLVDAPSSG